MYQNINLIDIRFPYIEIQSNLKVSFKYTSLGNVDFIIFNKIIPQNCC